MGAAGGGTVDEDERLTVQRRGEATAAAGRGAPSVAAPRTEPPLRIAQVNDIAAVGSVLARAMRELGHDARLVEPWRPGAAIPYPWKLALLPLRAAGLLGAAATLRRGRFDVIHVHYARLGIIGPLAGRPYALHVHGSDIRGVRPGSLWGRQTEPFLRRARLVYYATPDLAPWVLPFRRDAIFLPNPIESDRFRPRESSEPAGEPRRDLLVGVRLDPIKGLETILEVLRGLAVRRPETSITIVAQGSGLERARASAGRDTVMSPRVTRAELPDFYRGHRLALGQFQVGSMGNYELEALASGLPVVMRFDQGAAYEDPPPIVAVDAPDAAIEAIVKLLDEPARLRELSEEGAAWVSANHAASAIAGRLLADYVRSGLAG